MKLKALLLTLFVAGLTASFALADDGGHGKGKKEGAAAAAAAKANPCRPRIELELRGTVASLAGDSMAVTVAKGGAEGAKLAGKQLTFDVSQARVRGTVAPGATVRVHGRACVDLAAGTVALVATQVKVAGAESHGDETTSSTTTTTTE